MKKGVISVNIIELLVYVQNEDDASSGQHFLNLDIGSLENMKMVILEKVEKK